MTVDTRTPEEVLHELGSENFERAAALIEELHTVVWAHKRLGTTITVLANEPDLGERWNALAAQAHWLETDALLEVFAAWLEDAGCYGVLDVHKSCAVLPGDVREYAETRGAERAMEAGTD